MHVLARFVPSKFKITTIFSLILMSFILLIPPVTFAEEQKESTTQSKDTADKKAGKEDTSKSEENKDNATAPKNTFNRADINISAPTNHLEQKTADIEHYINKDKITPVLVGPESHITLVERHTTAINKGVMIILPDWQQGATSPKALNQLRQTLPSYGWTTITIQPPLKPMMYPSLALTQTEQDTENKVTLTAYKADLVSILSSVIEKAKSYPGTILTIAEGQHAALLVDIYQQELLPNPTALIMLSAYMQTQAENLSFAQQVAFSSYPILDLYLKKDHRLVKATIDVRKHAVRNELKAYYRQRQLFNQKTAYYPEKALTKEVVGWLKSIGW